MADIFISHSSKDKETADKVVEYLEERGLSCWIAPRNIVAGSDWAASISTAITSTKVFLLIYSENSAASEQVAREINLAETVEEVFVVPYKIDDTPLTGTYQYYLTGAHWIMADVSKKNYNFDELYLMLSGILGKTTQNITNNTYIDSLNIYHESSSVSSGSSSGKESKKKFIIAGAIGAVIVAAIVILFILFFTGKDNKPAETSDTSSSAEKNTPSYGTIADYKLTCETLEIKGVYKGNLNAEGLPEGTGEFKGEFSLGEENADVTVKGSFAHGEINGSASISLVYKSGLKELHESDSFVNGKVNGLKKSTINLAEGTEIYSECEFVDGVACGHGIGWVRYPNGNNEKFEGEYVDGSMNGVVKYTYTYAEGNTDAGLKMRVYEGEYKDGLMCGNGTLTIDYYNGSKEVYEGEFANNTYGGHGKLIIHYPETSTEEETVTYEGEFKDGVLNGFGTHNVEYVSGKVKTYEGDFADGLYDGEGTWNVDNVSSEKKSDSYTGSFKAGVFEGKGKRIMEYTDGDIELIDGDWVNGKTDGSIYYECIYAEPQGSAKIVRETYSGNVKEDVYNGMAIQKIFLETGTVISINGEWVDGKTVDGSTVTEQDKDGNLIKSGIYRNNNIEWQ